MKEDIFFLKSINIRDKRPKLVLCSNHTKDQHSMGRVWNSGHSGTVKSDGRGWYK